MDEKDSPKTAFSTLPGHFEYARMRFSLKNEPDQFQRAAKTALTGMNRVEALVYVNDIAVYAFSLQEHTNQ